MGIFERLPRVSTCCCGFDLEIGVYFLALWQLAYGILYIFLTMNHLDPEIPELMEFNNSNTEIYDEYDDISDENVYEVSSSNLYWHLTFDGLVIAFALILFYGLIRRSTLAIKVYIICELLMTSFSAFHFILILMLHFLGHPKLENMSKFVLVVETTRQLIIVPLTAYCLICCNSFIQELKHQQERERRDQSTVDYQPMSNEEYDLHTI
uniref:CSON015067 protein n=1 Tax=Culicoides sonorensis TaxID=179676 RepID=A0A336MPW4_CULSO